MILITGCNGFIGRNLSNHYLLLKTDFIGIDINVVNNSKNYFCINLLETNVLTQFLKYNLKVIVHSAAVLPSKRINAQAAKEINKIIDKNVFDFCEKYNIKLVYISGASVYAANEKKTINEKSSFLKLGDPYIMGKLDSEILLKKMNFQSIILRINAPYGYNQNTDTVINIFINRALNNLPLELYNSGSRIQDFTFISDISRAIIKAVNYDKSDDFIIASGKVITMKSLAKKIIKLSNSKSSIHYKKHEEKAYYPFYDITKAEKMLKWIPEIDLQAGLIKTILSN